MNEASQADVPACATTAKILVCGLCRESISPEADRCTHCGAVYSAEFTERLSFAARHQHWLDQPRNEDGTFAPGPMMLPSGVRRLFEVPEVEIQRLVTGIEPIDLVTGGGYAAGKAYAIHGPGGSGKSRFALASACALCSYGPVVYVSASAEEGAEMIRLHAKDAGYFDRKDTRDRLAVLDREDSPDEIVSKIAVTGPVFAVVDASSALEDERYAATVLRSLSHATGATLLSVFHETQEGRMSGGHKLPFLVDAVLDVDRVVRTKKGGWKGAEVSPTVRLRSGKNRFGPSGAYAVVKLDGGSFVPVEFCDGEKVWAPGESDDDEAPETDRGEAPQ